MGDKRIVTVSVPADQERPVTGRWESFVGAYAGDFCVFVCKRGGERPLTSAIDDEIILGALLARSTASVRAMYERIRGGQEP